jgi:hypothetical protein
MFQRNKTSHHSDAVRSLPNSPLHQNVRQRPPYIIFCAATAKHCQWLQSPTAFQIGANNVTLLYGPLGHQQPPYIILCATTAKNCQWLQSPTAFQIGAKNVTLVYGPLGH